MGETSEWALERYDNLSKGAFDVWDRVEFRKTAETAESFQDGVSRIMQQAGAPNEVMALVKDEHESWAEAFGDAATQASDWATDTAVAGVLAAMGLQAWIPAAENVVSKFRTNWRDAKAAASDEKMGMLKPGQWVYLNRGRAPEPGWHDGLRRRMIGVGPTAAIPPGDKITMGFYIGPANQKGTVQVFNFELFRSERVDLDDVAPCGTAKSRDMDANRIMSAIRDLKIFPKEPAAKMSGHVPTDPGTEVVYDDNLYNIVRSEGGEALIEDEFGQRKTVSVLQLEAGRVNHTNSWNYREGKPFNTGFEADGAARIHTGQWVWVGARDEFINAGVTTHELGVVWKIQRDGIYVFQAVDGSLVVVDEVWSVSDTLLDVLSVKKNALQFKSMAVEGGDTQSVCMGHEDMLLSIGKTNETGAKFPTPITPGEKLEPHPTQEQPTVGDGGVKERVDATEEVKRTTGVEPPYEQDPEFQRPPQAGGGLMVYAVMAGLALLVYNSVDVNLNLLGGIN